MSKKKEPNKVLSYILFSLLFFGIVIVSGWLALPLAKDMEGIAEATEYWQTNGPSIWQETGCKNAWSFGFPEAWPDYCIINNTPYKVVAYEGRFLLK